MLANASFVYPENTPTTKEGYYYRTIFERFFPKVSYNSALASLSYRYLPSHYIYFCCFESNQNAARSTVPGGPSVACSTAKAVEWDASWSKNPDPSGRAALGIHAAAYEDAPDAKTATSTETSAQKLEVEKASVAVWLCVFSREDVSFFGVCRFEKSDFISHSLLVWLCIFISLLLMNNCYHGEQTSKNPFSC